MNGFMSDEPANYEGKVEVVHTLADSAGAEDQPQAISAKVVKPLNGLRVACYYGCLLMRPRIGRFRRCRRTRCSSTSWSRALGGEPVDFSQKTECCGAYQTVDKPEIIADRTNQILTDAREQGADVVAVSCPLCAFNLDQRQEITHSLYPDFEGLARRSISPSSWPSPSAATSRSLSWTSTIFVRAPCSRRKACCRRNAMSFGDLKKAYGNVNINKNWCKGCGFCVQYLPHEGAGNVHGVTTPRAITRRM